MGAMTPHSAGVPESKRTGSSTPSAITTAARVRVGVATMLVALMAGFSAAWLLGKMNTLAMVFNTSVLITAAALAGAVTTYYAVRATGRGGPGAAAARVSCGVLIAAGAASVAATLATQAYAAEMIAILWLDGLLLRGIVPVAAAVVPLSALTAAGATVGVVWGARAWVEQQRALAALGDAAPKPLVSRTQLVAGAIVVAAGAAAYYLIPDVRTWVDTAIMVLSSGDVTYVRDYLRGFGVWAPVVSSLLMIVQSIAAPLPAFVVTFSNGLLFGWLWGALLSWSSAMAGAALCFWLARTLGRPAVERLAGGSTGLEVSDLFFKRYGDRAVLVARLLPFVSFDIISYGAGLTSIGFWRFFIATGIGQLPATLVYSYLGQNLTGSMKVLFFIFLFTAVVFVVGASVRPYFMRKIRTEVIEERIETADVPA